jgi:hypothetical protein
MVRVSADCVFTEDFVDFISSVENAGKFGLVSKRTACNLHISKSFYSSFYGSGFEGNFQQNSQCYFADKF